MLSRRQINGIEGKAAPGEKLSELRMCLHSLGGARSAILQMKTEGRRHTVLRRKLSGDEWIDEYE